MLAKKNRLSPIEFYQNPGQSQKLNLFFGSLSVKSAKNNSLPRFAIIVPAKLDKRSVYRHSTKRIIMEAIHKNLPDIKKGMEVFIRTNKILDKKDRESIESEIERSFRKIGLL